ncbi:hypothetical protein B484DRAFT_459206 [Ochromonadaceae sp. CCMP2298]|nr:hypothetical protein B484DRAFT_459206 [Ochromonadaceae sp. CCMP2298]|mmetsp:Transcript_22579/g.50201  ORF Transcript_22579/g.50201 Transcript_22579/m.50201 type:complete len:310 (-) Transcript_22579:113-1042(-)
MDIESRGRGGPERRSRNDAGTGTTGSGCLDKCDSALEVKRGILSRVEGAGKQLVAFERDLDDRLFPDHPLYCEGMLKPKLRGVIHLFYALLLPLGIWHLHREANGSLAGQIAGVIFVLSNLYCVGVSALYHCCSWTPSQEILIQKLDHCGIAIYAAGVNVPVSLLLLEPVQGAVLLLLTLMSTGWTCWHVLNSRPAVWRFLVVALTIVLFFPVLAYRFSAFEWACALLNILTQGSGMTVFVNRTPDLWPGVFGYHELFHLICIIGMTVTYLANWSVIRRTCNPYAHQTEVLELLLPFLMGVRGVDSAYA